MIKAITIHVWPFLKQKLEVKTIIKLFLTLLSSSRLRLSPAARHILDTHGLEPKLATATGPRGLITKEWVRMNGLALRPVKACLMKVGMIQNLPADIYQQADINFIRPSLRLYDTK